VGTLALAILDSFLALSLSLEHIQKHTRVREVKSRAFPSNIKQGMARAKVLQESEMFGT
jgi:hypothetical protein